MDSAYWKIDWKTGSVPRDREPETVTTQLALYTWWMKEKLSLKDELLERVEAYEFYLPGGEIFGGPVSREDLEIAFDVVRSSVSKIRAMLADPASNRAEEEDFPAEGSPQKCGNCQFRTVCPERGCERGAGR